MNSPSHTEQQVIQLSLDGVNESKSSTVSLDVYTMKFEGCRDIFPIKIIRPINKYQIDLQEQFSLVLNSVESYNLILQALIGDNPKRAFFRNSSQHSATNGYEYCFESGVSFKQIVEIDSAKFVKNIQIQKRKISEQISGLSEIDNCDQIESLKSILQDLDQAEKIGKKIRQSSHIVWPANTMFGELRTKEKTLDIVEKIEAGEEISHSERKGIKGRSLVLNLDYFDYVISIPAEYMHLLSLGVVRRLLELTFSVGETRSRNIKRPLTLPNQFNELIQSTKFFKELSRRARKLDLSVMKAQELRNVLIFFSHL